jgi:tetratricopeptide (TPR) repeat protein
LVDAASLPPPDEAGLAATRDGAVLGTPAWMSPEQALGAAAKLDARTDVWALGAILYQLLTGRRPFSGETSGQVLRAITTGELVPVLQACPESPPELAAVAERALRKNPQERYPSAQELAAELEAWTSGGRVAAHDYTSLQLLRKFYARNRLASWALGAALCAVAAGVGGTSLQARRAREERDSARRELAYAGGAAELLKFLVTASASKPMTSVDLLAKAEEMAVGRFNGEAETRARLQLLIGSAYGEVFDLERSLTVLEKARASAAAAALPPLQAVIDCQLGTTLSDLEKKDEAGLAFERGLGLLREAAEPLPWNLASCLNARADWHASRGEAEAMLADMTGALAAAEATQPLDRTLLSDIHTGLAEAYSRVGRAADSVAAYDLAIDDLRRAGKLDSSAGGWRVANYSQALYRAGRVLQAAEVMREALRISSGLGVADAAQLTMIRNYLARSLTDLGKPEEARPLFEQALASARSRHDEMWQGVIALTAAHAFCSPVPAEAARAAALLDEAEPLVQKTLPPRSQVRPLLPLERACVAAATGDDARAGEALRQAIRDFDAASELSPQRIRARALLSSWALRQGDLAEATRVAGEAVAQARELSRGISGSQWLGEALAAQAAVQQRAGAPEAAAVAAEALSQLAVAWGRDAPAYRAVERALGAR